MKWKRGKQTIVQLKADTYKVPELLQCTIGVAVHILINLLYLGNRQEAHEDKIKL